MGGGRWKPVVKLIQNIANMVPILLNVKGNLWKNSWIKYVLGRNQLCPKLWKIIKMSPNWDHNIIVLYYCKLQSNKPLSLLLTLLQLNRFFAIVQTKLNIQLSALVLTADKNINWTKFSNGFQKYLTSTTSGRWVYFNEEISRIGKKL